MNKTINISRQEYELYLMIYGGRMQLRGFRKGRIPPIMLHSMIGSDVQNIITDHKVREFLKDYDNVKNVKVRTINGNEPENVFTIELEFDGNLKQTEQTEPTETVNEAIASAE